MLSEKYKAFLGDVIYQIYPRSFCDSNGDGIGDLQGIISKLDYIKELGATAIWLCPCYKSPNEDNGYDVADYRDIMDEFGSMDDMKQLISEMHSRNLKLIMDLVPNHTSSEHEWFKQSRMSKDNPYSDFYYWFDEPINNWQSCFGGTAWQYDDVRKQYYLHSYAVHQPDLNWENPAVVKEMQDVVDFWIDMGVDGFRIDVIDQISKDFSIGRNCFGPTLHQHIKELFGREKAEKLFTVGECWANDIEEIARHCKYERGELSTLFQFDHLECGRSEKFTKTSPCLKEARDILIKWQTLCQQEDILHSLFTDNHDNSRFISRAANDRELRYESATCVATMFYALRGVPFIFQGQEFGMPASHHDSIEDFDDVETMNKYAELLETLPADEALEKINFGSRDNPRRPMTWNDGKNFGFSSEKPWIPVHSRGAEVNLKADLGSKKSVFRFYQQLLKLRKASEALTYGDFEVLSKPEDNFFAFKRMSEHETAVVVCNFEDASSVSSLPEGKIKLSNLGRSRINGEYKPYECAVCIIRNEG